MDKENRQYSRVSTNVSVEFFQDSVDSDTQRHLQGIAQNCGLGGMFIATTNPFPQGSIIWLVFKKEGELMESESTYVHAIVRCVVRWAQTVVQPQGMGVKFVEIKGMESLAFANLVATFSK